MDGLSAAASAMAVVSLAFQLADTAKRLCDFWSSIKDAPEDIRTIIADLELLTSVLAEMVFEAQHTGPDTTLAAVLQSCTGKLKSLTALTNNLEPGFSSRSSRVRKWTAIRFVLKSEKLTRFQDVLESLKSTLVLAQQNRHSSLSRIQHETQLEKMTIIAQKLDSLFLQHSVATVTTVSKEPADTQSHISALRAETARVNETLEDPLLRLGFAIGSEKAVHQIQNKKGTTDSTDEVYDEELTSIPSGTLVVEEDKKFSNAKVLTQWTWEECNTTNYFFGTIHTYSTTRQLQSNKLEDQELDDEEHHYERRSTLILRPAAWLVNLGLNSGLRVGLFNSSVQGWKGSLNTFCAVPDDSLIFNMCNDGNLSAVRDLFSRGLASVRDTNSMGETPLHVAAESRRPELCKFLIAAGADKSLRSKYYWENYLSPIMAACCSSTSHFQLSNGMDTIRLFTDEMDFAEEDGDGWAALRCMNDYRSSFEPDLFVWLLQSFSQEIRTHFVRRHYTRFLGTAFWPGKEKVARLLLELGPAGAIDTVIYEGGYTALQISLCEPEFSDLERILALDPDLHHLGSELLCSPVEESPLSLALYSSHKFRDFADALKKRHIDLDDFVLQELREKSPLINDGWTRQTLRALVDHDFEPGVRYRGVWCCDECHDAFESNGPMSRGRVEIAWQHHLEDFKEWHSQIASKTMNSHEDLAGNIPEDAIQDQTSLDPIRDFQAWSFTDGSGHSPSGSDYAEREVDQVSWEERFRQHNVVCAHCWQRFKDGLRDPHSAMQNDSAEEDDVSEEDFSPFLFNT